MLPLPLLAALTPRHPEVLALHAPLFHEVDCIRLITSANSTQFPLTWAHLQAIGLAPRVSVQIAELAKVRELGAFLSHAKAWEWGYVHNCRHLIVLEDDMFFEAELLDSGSALVDHALLSGTPFDMLELGYGISENMTCATPLSADSQLVRIKDWKMTHAYIVPRRIMQYWQEVTFLGESQLNRTSTSTAGNASGNVSSSAWGLEMKPLDVVLSSSGDSDVLGQGRPFLTIALKPMIAFQRYHPSTSSTMIAALNDHVRRAFDAWFQKMSKPSAVHELEASLPLCGGGNVTT